MDADEFALVLEFLRQRIDRQRRGVGGEDRVRLQQRLRLGVGFGLDLAVLEHRFDDEVAILQHVVVGGGADARQDGVAVGLLGAALLDQVVDHRLGVALALVGAFLIAVDQHHVDARARRDVADAGAHETGADDGEFLHLGRRHVRRTPRALVQFLHRQEQAADHRRRFLGLQDVREVARLHAQRRIHRQLQALIGALHDRARGGIVVVGLAAVDRVAGGEDHHAVLGKDRTARQLETLLVPRRDRLAAALDPVLCGLDQIGRRHHRADDVLCLGLGEIDRFALQQHLHRILRLQHARQPLRAAAAGEQPDLDFRQAEAGLGIVRRDAIVTRQRQFERAAEREAVDRGDPRLAAGLDLAQRQRQLSAFIEQHLLCRFLAFRLSAPRQRSCSCLPASTDRRRRKTLPCRT